jgi:hypothetical protein
MADEANGQAGGDLAAPYMPFQTLINLLLRIDREGTPRRLDGDYLSNMSGGTRSQLIAGLRWFGLIDAEDRPQARLTELAKAGDGRPAEVAKLWRERYAWALALVPENGTQGDLDEAFRKHNVSGSTLRKATAFFLQGAKYANVPLSPFFRQPRVEGGGGTPRRRAATKPSGPARPRPGVLPRRRRPPTRSWRTPSSAGGTRCSRCSWPSWRHRMRPTPP